MARTQVEFCMFCGNTPCTCEETAPKPKAKPKLPAIKKIETPPVPPQEQSPPKRTALQQTSQVQENANEDAALRRALTVFAEGGLMSADDIEKYGDRLYIDPERRRILAWKQRRIETVLLASEQTSTKKESGGS